MNTITIPISFDHDAIIEKYGIKTIAETEDGIKVKLGFDVIEPRQLIIYADDNGHPVYLGRVNLNTLKVDLSDSEWGNFSLSDEAITATVENELAKHL